MSRHRFVKPEIVRLKLSDGDYIDVKKRLNTGEHQDMLARMTPYQMPGLPVQMNSLEVMRARVLAYLVSWSLTDDGTPVPYELDQPEATRLETLRSLDPDTFREIRTAIEDHEDVQDAQREAEKNGMGGGTELPATSPSPSTTAGAMSGSTN